MTDLPIRHFGDLIDLPAALVEDVENDPATQMIRRVFARTGPHLASLQSIGGGCRTHGPDCHIPWGYDPAHTDTDRPYTVDELAARQTCPHRYAYATHDAYLAGWRLWLSLRRDAHTTNAEDAVRMAGNLTRMAADDTVVSDPDLFLTSMAEAFPDAAAHLHLFTR